IFLDSLCLYSPTDPANIQTALTTDAAEEGAHWTMDCLSGENSAPDPEDDAQSDGADGDEGRGLRQPGMKGMTNRMTTRKTMSRTSRSRVSRMLMKTRMKITTPARRRARLQPSSVFSSLTTSATAPAWRCSASEF